MHALVHAVIGELAHGGDGVAIVEAEGERRAVFVWGTAPGDAVLLDVDFTTRPATGRIVRLEAAGPSRVEPPCPHALRCGGCGWMHVSLDGQMQSHRERIRASLPGDWRDVTLELHAPLLPLGYRTRARLHARGSGGRAVVGFDAAGTHDPVEVDRCVALHPALEAARLLLAPVLEGAHGRGEAQIALGAQGKPVLELSWRGRLPAALFARLEKGVADGAWAGARVFEGDVSRPASIGDPTPWTTAGDGEALRLAPGGFAQASDTGNEALSSRLLSLAKSVVSTRTGKPGLGKVAELFAGAGNFTVLLARHAEHLVAVESSGPSCDALRMNLAARGLTGQPTHARAVEGLAEEHRLEKGLDLVVLDPPRTGARLVMDRIVEARPRVVAYVSCDVPTLARDLGVLQSSYAPVALEAFVMFPQTPHVECLAVLAVRGGRDRAERRRPRPRSEERA
jgi:23S rRNA (uracil1939-C5)-methyltransferase